MIFESLLSMHGLNIGSRAKPNVLPIRCCFPVRQTRNGCNNFAISLNLHIQTMHA